MVALLHEGIPLIVPVPGHGHPWRPVVPPSLGARCRPPLRFSPQISARLRPPIMSLRLSLPEHRSGGERGRHPSPIANIIVGLKALHAQVRPAKPPARHHGGPFLLAVFLTGQHPSHVSAQRQHRCQLRSDMSGVLTVFHPLALLPCSVACQPGGSFVALFPGR